MFLPANTTSVLQIVKLLFRHVLTKIEECTTASEEQNYSQPYMITGQELGELIAKLQDKDGTI